MKLRESVKIRELLLLVLLLPYVLSSKCPTNLSPSCACENVLPNIDIKCNYSSSLRIQGLLIKQNNSNLQQLINVKVLNLTFNELSDLPTDFFNGINSVNILDLSNNNFSSIPKSVNIMSNISQLLLSNNIISRLKCSDISKRFSKQVLDVSHNKINDVCLNESDLPDMDFINLSHNLVKNPPAKLWTIAKTLNLSYNQISRLSPVPTAQLQNLVLSGNLLRTIPDECFAGLVNVKNLYLSNNKISSLKSTSFKGLSSLIELILSSNQLNTLERGTFQNLHNLLKLDLSDNNIQVLKSSMFNGLEKPLEYLSLRNNNLLHIDESLHQLNSLRYIDLSSNIAITDIDHIGFPPHIISLDVSNCGIQEVSDCKFLDFLDLQDLNLSGNNLICSCHLSWLQNRLKKNRQHDHSKAKAKNGWICQNPDGKNKSVSSDLSQCPDHKDNRFHCYNKVTLTINPDDVSLTISVSPSEETVSVSWEIKTNNASIHGFQIAFKEGEETLLESPVLANTIKRYTLKGLKIGEDNTVCVYVLYNTSEVIKEECEVLPSNSLTIVTGILAGVVFLIPCIAAMIYILYKDRIMMKDEYTAIDAESPMDKDVFKDKDVKDNDVTKNNLDKEPTVVFKHEVNKKNVSPKQKKSVMESVSEETNCEAMVPQSNAAFVADCGKSHQKGQHPKEDTKVQAKHLDCDPDVNSSTRL